MRKLLYLLIAMLLLPALLVNLGEVVFIDDEGIRSLVAQEMLWSGNYIAPTLHGDAYLNKPPLWNWILALSFSIWGETSEWAARFPTVIALLGFTATTFFFSRKFFDKNLALIHALTVITCGRMLFWDSMLALIDTCFSWVVYTQIMVLYYYGRKGDWWRAFGFGYLLAAIGFMMKGLPAIAFTGITVITLLLYLRSFKQFIRPPHLLSGIGCLAILGLYYATYSQYVDLSLVAERLFTESGKRTAVNHAWQETVQHLLAFPFEMAYHFLPWTFLLVFLLQKRSWQRLKTNDAAAFMLVVFLANLPLYWMSPNVYPRYLLMLFPLLFGSGLYLWQQHARENTRSYRVFMGFLTGLMSVSAVVIFFIPLIPKTEIVAYRWPLAVLLGVLGIGITALMYGRWLLPSAPKGNLADGSGGISDSDLLPSAPTPRRRPVVLRERSPKVRGDWIDGSGEASDSNSDSDSHSHSTFRLLAFCAFLLLLRLVLNVFVLPPRAVDDIRGEKLKISAEKLVENIRASGQDLAVFGYTQMEPASSYYLEKAYGGIVPRQFENFDSTTVYLVNPWQYPEVKGTVVDSLYMRHQQLHYSALLLWSPNQVSADYEEELADGMGTGLMINGE